MIPKGFEWIVILIVVLVIFGPKNLPKLGKSLGSTVKNLREGMSGDDKTAEEPEESAEDREIRELEAGRGKEKEGVRRGRGPHLRVRRSLHQGALFFL